MSEVDPVSGTRLEAFIPSGITTRPEQTLLAERAADYLKAGPADARALIASVCQLSALPAAVAEHMAISLLGGHPRFARTVDGAWRLSEPAAPAWRAQVAEQEPTLSSLSFAVVDVETTGGRPDHGDRITEIAAVTVRDGAIVDVYETLVNPERSIPPFITRLTNISWDMVRDKSPFRDDCARCDSPGGSCRSFARGHSIGWLATTAWRSSPESGIAPPATHWPPRTVSCVSSTTRAGTGASGGRSSSVSSRRGAR